MTLLVLLLDRSHFVDLCMLQLLSCIIFACDRYSEKFTYEFGVENFMVNFSRPLYTLAMESG